MDKSKADRDHYADQNNPNNPAYQDRIDNRSDQLNPNHDEYQGDRDHQDNDKQDKSDD